MPVGSPAASWSICPPAGDGVAAVIPAAASAAEFGDEDVPIYVRSKTPDA